MFNCVAIKSNLLSWQLQVYKRIPLPFFLRMSIRLHSYLKRDALISLRNFFRSTSAKLSQIFRLVMSQSSADPQVAGSSEDLAPFNPSEPSIPISYPIKTLEDLESRSYFESFHYPFNKASSSAQPNPAPASAALPDRPRLLVCHDMAGGYLDDKWVQGGSNPEAYAIWHWHLMDIFVYFSHSLVTIPPPGWINAAHKHGVKVLGTFITEWDEGRRIANSLLATEDSAHLYAERLTELAVALGFDGWLINMEVKLETSLIPHMKAFVTHLTHTMHSSKPGSLVIWYDSVTIDGHLDWQDQLNDKNKPFFDLCDGIFINYTWKEYYPRQSASVAGSRKFDIYMGIDVFGRNTFGGGQWNTNVALDVVKREDVSAAIFAPAWVYETKQPPNFETAQNRWWALVEKSWGIAQSYPTSVPFYSNFDQGRGYHLSVDGKQVSDAHWSNISSQSFQPFLELLEGSQPKAMQAYANLKEPSYSGGGNMTFKGFIGEKDYFTTRLFEANLFIDHITLLFTYSVNLGEDSLMGLSLELSSAEGLVSVLLAAQGDSLMTMSKFSRLFTKVIMPHKVTKLGSDQGWIMLEHIVAMDQYTLTRISAVCYKLKLEVDKSTENSFMEGASNHSYSEYYSVLGHLSIDTPSQDEQLPPSKAWVVEGKSIKWAVDPPGSKLLSLEVQWRLKGGYDFFYEKCNVYVKKIPKQEGGNNGEETPEGGIEYLGVAKVAAFYVSDLVVPLSTCNLKFIIQICGVDGRSQKLEDSPYLLLDVEGAQYP